MGALQQADGGKWEVTNLFECTKDSYKFYVMLKNLNPGTEEVLAVYGRIKSKPSPQFAFYGDESAWSTLYKKVREKTNRKGYVAVTPDSASDGWVRGLMDHLRDTKGLHIESTNLAPGVFKPSSFLIDW